MVSTLPQIINDLIIYRYLLLFPIVVIEGPIISVLAGFLCSLGYFNLLVVYLVVIVGDLAGDVLYYSVGRYGGRKFIDRWGKYLGLSFVRVKKIDDHFENHPGKTLVLGKLAHGIGGLTIVAAGMARVPILSFLWYNFLATIPKSLILVLIGYYFGKSYVNINKYLDLTALLTLGLAILLVVIYFIIKKRAEKREINRNSDSKF